ncbi:MAG: hypothetical protein ABFD50_11870 [Smithella sp.]
MPNPAITKSPKKGYMDIALKMPGNKDGLNPNMPAENMTMGKISHFDCPIHSRSKKIMVITVTTTKKRRLKRIKSAVPMPGKKMLFINLL